MDKYTAARDGKRTLAFLLSAVMIVTMVFAAMPTKVYAGEDGTPPADTDVASFPGVDEVGGDPGLAPGERNPGNPDGTDPVEDELADETGDEPGDDEPVPETDPEEVVSPEDEAISSLGDDGTTNYDFIVPVAHLTEVPNGYTAITTPAELAAITPEGQYILMNDIDLGEYNGGEWIPIGTSSASFNGILNGNGYVISNMHVDTTGNAGLFGYVGGTTTIRNLGVEESEVISSSSSGSTAGGLIGSSYSPAYPNYDYSLTIENSYYAGDVTAVYPAGGLIGNASADSESQSSSLTIENSYNSGIVTSSTAGGLIGNTYNLSLLAIDNSYSQGTVCGGGSNGYGGGLVGSALSGSGNLTINNSYNIGEVTGWSVGGLVGKCVYLSISNSYNAGNVTTGSIAGGNAGGLVGASVGGGSLLTVENSYNSGNVTSFYNCAGGIVGSTSGLLTIKNSYNTGNVNVTSTGYAGGLAGTTGGSSSVAIEKCYNTGTVNATYKAGGLVGIAVDISLTIMNSFNTGDVTSSSSGAGGLVGLSYMYYDTEYSSSLTITNSYNAGNVNGIYYQDVYYGGGLVTSSSEDSSLTIENGYYLKTSQINAAVGDMADAGSVKGYTRAQLLNIASYAGFDFESVWSMPETTAEYPYPVLVGLPAPQGYVVGDDIDNNKYTITFDARGGTAAAAKSIVKGKAIGTLPTTTRTGYAFKGWYTKTSGGTKITTKTKPAKDVTYYAQWTAKSYTVTYNVNGGKALSARTKTVKYGSAYGTLAAPARTGYSFAGWWTTKSGGTKIAKTTTVETAKAHTLYAHWTAKTYTATFNANGGKVSPVGGGDQAKTTKQSVTYAAKFGALPAPTQTNKIFAGWYTAKSGGTKITKTSTVKITKNTTYYAHWTAAWTVKFDSNIIDGMEPVENPTAKLVKKKAAVGTLPALSQDGYVFSGWYTKASGGTKIKTTTKPTKHVTYYAHWTPTA
jgi:uncharacterized repeat protein (TIGR02543 family)